MENNAEIEYRVEQIQAKPTARLVELGNWATSIKNTATWYMRQEYFHLDLLQEVHEDYKFLGYYDLRDMVRYNNAYRQMTEDGRKEVKKDEYMNSDWKVIPSTAANLVKTVRESFASYFKAMKSWRSDPSKFTGKPRLPSYDRDEMSAFKFDYGQIRVDGGKIHFPSKAGLKPLRYKKAREFEAFGATVVKDTYFKKSKNIKEVRVIPMNGLFVFEIVYPVPIVNLRLNPERVIGIDLGVNNIVTVVNNFGERPFAIRGGVAKSTNQFYNKAKSRLKSELARTTPRIADLQRMDEEGLLDRHSRIELRKLTADTAAMEKLSRTRNDKIKRFFHHVSRYIVDYCIDHDVGTIIVGHNKQQKTGVNIGRRNNQNFTALPLFKLVDGITYKARAIGIEVARVNESYTSKCSFLDNEPLKKQETYVGRRLKRGLFKSESGILINADVNGAFNIIRKKIPEFTVSRIGNIKQLLHPILVNVYGKMKKQSRKPAMVDGIGGADTAPSRLTSRRENQRAETSG